MSFSIRPIRDDQKTSPSFARRALNFVSRAVEPISNLYLLTKRKHEVEQEERANHTGLLKKALAVLVAILFAGLLLVGTLRVLLAMKVFSISQLVSVASVELPVDDNGYTNLLLLGEGGADHDGVDLTDTLMIASIDARHNEGVVLLSLPRDLYVLNTEKMGKGRINSLYRNYKGYLIAQGSTHPEAEAESLKQLGTEIGTLVDLPIHGVLKIDFNGFIDAVDAVGGVDVDVPEDIVDVEYPGPNYTYETFSITKGSHHLDGATALKYARTRHTTSDFSRSARQQQIISAVMQKMRETGTIGNLGKVSELLSIVSKNFRTTLSSRELMGLAVLGKGVDAKKLANVQLNDQNGLYGSLIQPGGFLYSPPREEFDGASVLLPFSIPAFPVTWKQIRVLTEVFIRHRDLFMNPPSIAVLNADAKEGAARKLGGELYRYMFNVTQTKNYDKKATPAREGSYIVVRAAPTVAPSSSAGSMEAAVAQAAKAKKTAEYLSALLQLPILDTVDTAALADGTDLSIVLADDYTYQPLQDVTPLK
jgi:LCP family protein required for cell wall assembly